MLLLQVYSITTEKIITDQSPLTLDAIAEIVKPINDELLAKNATLWALEELVRVIESAGTINLSKGVQIGGTVWYVKCEDAMKRAKAAIAAERDINK